MSSGRIPESEPPDAELGEAAERARGKGLTVIGADPLGEPVGAEEPPEDLLGGLQKRALEPIAGQEIPGVGVLDRERVAVAAIAEPELALEVDRPDDIGPPDRGLRAAGMGPDPRAAPPADAAMPGEDPVDGGGRRDLRGRMGLKEELVEFAGAQRQALRNWRISRITAGVVA